MELMKTVIVALVLLHLFQNLQFKKNSSST